MYKIPNCSTLFLIHAFKHVGKTSTPCYKNENTLRSRRFRSGLFEGHSSTLIKLGKCSLQLSWFNRVLCAGVKSCWNIQFPLGKSMVAHRKGLSIWRRYKKPIVSFYLRHGGCTTGFCDFVCYKKCSPKKQFSCVLLLSYPQWANAIFEVGKIEVLVPSLHCFVH